MHLFQVLYNFTKMPSVTTIELLATACMGIALKSIVSMHSHSGSGVAPMYGDYEAQRHWQEVTINIDSVDWYRNSTDNDLLYWGLDYPPLTAYHSYLMGQIAQSINHSYVALHSSRGIETKQHKSFMRLTVLAADILIYMPATLCLSICLDRTFGKKFKLQTFVLFALYPGQILIDNGHFQYNNISLGLAMIAIAAILRDRHYLAAFLFTLSLNYKQMELYHALPFFAYLLSLCLSQKSFGGFLSKLATIAAIVVSTFIVLWFPWLQSFAATSQLVQRLFPVGRGVFEDKVANFWCAVNVVFKLKKHFTNNQMAVVCLATTVVAALPTNILLAFRRNKPSFLLALFNTAAAFFLFSFQVHEKTILLLALPACCLSYWWPKEMFWFLEVSVFSMLPLLMKDKLLVPTIALLVIFHLTFKCFKLDVEKQSEAQLAIPGVFISISEFLMIATLILSLYVTPPQRFPDLWPLIISLISCAHFMLFLLWGNMQQLTFRDPKK